MYSVLQLILQLRNELGNFAFRHGERNMLIGVMSVPVLTYQMSTSGAVGYHNTRKCWKVVLAINVSTKPTF